MTTHTATISCPSPFSLTVTAITRTSNIDAASLMTFLNLVWKYLSAYLAQQVSDRSDREYGHTLVHTYFAFSSLAAIP